MKKCTKCGKTIQEGNFCPYCGEKIMDDSMENNFFQEEHINKEKAEKDDLKQVVLKIIRFFKNNKKFTAVVVGILFIVIIISFISQRGKSFDAINYVQSVSGVNGHAYYSEVIDYESLAEDILSDSKVQEKVHEYFKGYTFFGEYEQDDYEMFLEEKLEDSLDVRVDVKKGKQGLLKNGDKIKFTLIYKDKKSFQKMGIRFSPNSKTITIKGLENAKTVDYFKGMTIDSLGLEGIAPYATVNANVSNTLPDGKEISMSCSPCDGLSNGDKVTVTIDNNQVSEGAAYLPKNKSKTFIVKGLDEYVTKLEQIDKDTINLIVKQARDTATSYAAGDSDYGTISLTPIGTYLLTKKEQISDEYCNKVFVVFKAQNTIAGKKIESYSYISFKNVEIIDDKVRVDLGDYHSPYESGLFNTEGGESYGEIINDTTYYVKGFKSIEELFNQKVETDIAQYDVDASEGLYKR